MFASLADHSTNYVENSVTAHGKEYTLHRIYEGKLLNKETAMK